MKPLLSKLKLQNFKVAICKSTKVLFVLFVLLVSFPSVGNASLSVAADANENALTKVLCNVYKVVTGKAGKTFAAFAIISAGIGFFTGKLQWGLLIALTLGIAAIFGSPTIVAAITGDGTKGATQCNDAVTDISK